MSHPKIKGIRWLDEELPDLIAISITLVNKSIQDLDIPGLDLPTTPGELYIDLGKLSGLTPWYAKGSDEPSENECLIDVEGMESFLCNVNMKNMLQAWLYYKHHKK